MNRDTVNTGRSLPLFSLVMGLAGSLLVLLVVAPLAGLLLASSVGELSSAVADQEVLKSIGLTLSAALVATVLCALLGVPLAYVLARRDFWGRSILLAIVDLPIIIPHSAAGVAILTLVGRRAMVGSFLDETLGLRFVGTFAGIVLAMSFVSVPFLINAARAGFEAVPERLERAARTLGARPTRVFFTISLPMAWRDIASGMVLMWGRGISEFGAVIIIAYYPMTTPVMVFQRFNDYGLAASRALAVVLIIVCVTIFAGVRILARNNREDR